MGTLQLLKYEVIFHWPALCLYLAASVFFAVAVFSTSERGLGIGRRLTLIGLLPHTVALLVRWYAAGHAPYLGKAETLSSLAWVSAVIFLALDLKVPRLRGIGVVVLPCCLLLMLVSLLYNEWLSAFIVRLEGQGQVQALQDIAVRQPPTTFHGIWFVIHITANIIAMSSLLIALGAALIYLLKSKRPSTGFYNELPSLEVIDDYSYGFTGFGFIAYTVMIIAGAVWAEQAWGRYWNWDALEIWSLLTWFGIGLYLHLRRFFNWRGEKASWLLLGCFALSLVTLFFIPFIMKTIHTEFFV